MSWDLLQRFFESDVFNSNPFLSVSYLSRYADHVGIHYVLCNKLRQFPYPDMEFFLPQLCHLIISVNNESMALEEFLLDLCEESVTAALLTFWLFQTYLHDLSSNPQTDAFQTCRRVYNKVQNVVFGLPDTARRDKITENVLPVTVLASFVLASVGVPFLPRWAGPMAIAQARKPSPPSETANATAAAVTAPQSETATDLPPSGRGSGSGSGSSAKPSRSYTTSSAPAKPRRPGDGRGAGGGPRSPALVNGRPRPNGAAAEPLPSPRLPKSKQQKLHSLQNQQSQQNQQNHQNQQSQNQQNQNHQNHQKHVPKSPRPESSMSNIASPSPPRVVSGTRDDQKKARRPAALGAMQQIGVFSEARLSSSSLPLPELRSPQLGMRPSTPASAGLRPQDLVKASASLTRRHSHHTKTSLASVADMTREQRVRLLHQNYFHCETQLLRALEDISNRLVAVPKPARLSALRAELALISQDLPAEVDIPVICPPTLINGSPGRCRRHRIVRLNPAEATVLNSAEKVPYLLMVEILREDFTFDPDSSDNQRLLAELLGEQGARKRIFDLSDSGAFTGTSRASDAAVAAAAAAAAAAALETEVDSVFEPTSGDLGQSPLLLPVSENENGSVPPLPGRLSESASGLNLQQDGKQDGTVSASSGNGDGASGSTATKTGSSVTTFSDGTPRSSTASTPRSGSPAPVARKTTLPLVRSPLAVEQPDFSALATHMRTASQMLAQLDATSGKRPRQEVAAIRAKIIASMQSFEEHSFDLDDGQGPTFDLIIAKASAEAAAAEAKAAGAKAAAASAASAGSGTASASASASASTTTVSATDEDAAVDAEEKAEAAAAAAAAAASNGERTGVNPNAGIARMENDFKTGGLLRKGGDRDDPSAAVFGEDWELKRERIRRSSPYGWMKNWDLVSVIVKTGADLRQEAFACQLITVCDKIWHEAGVSVWVKLMRILVTGESSGLIETITNGVSLHSIKRSLTLASIEAGQNPRRRIATLKDYFVKAFGADAESEAYRAGVDAFKRSLAAYSIISYVLQLKDRHNGNVLVDSEGHIVHIDFGFMLSNSPGSVAFEAAPFKLTHEYVEVLGGLQSAAFEDYKRLCKQAFQALRKSADNIVDLVSMMGRGSSMPCFAAGVVQTTANLRQRFQLHLSAEDAEQFVETELIGKSLGSYYTRLYDTFQYRTQGIY